MTTDPAQPAALVLGGLALPTTATCPECRRVFNLLDEDDADEWFSGHDCEQPEPAPRQPLDRPPRMRRNHNGWHCLDCGFQVILFDDDEHDCDVTGTTSNVNPPTDDDEEGT